MKRKNIAVCTAVILTLSLLAGCGKNAETNSGAAAGASGTEAAQEDSSVGEAVIPEENTLPIVEPGSLPELIIGTHPPVIHRIWKSGRKWRSVPELKLIGK